MLGELAWESGSTVGSGQEACVHRVKAGAAKRQGKGSEG